MVMGYWLWVIEGARIRRVYVVGKLSLISRISLISSISMDVDLPTADFFLTLMNTSHIELPTAVLYGWLPSLMPNGILPCGQKAPQYISRGFRRFRRIGMLKHAAMRMKRQVQSARAPTLLYSYTP